MDKKFESFANSKRYKTAPEDVVAADRLRALLIQKDTKQSIHCTRRKNSLRALLIQKDTKQSYFTGKEGRSLRALLIQKDTKRTSM